jgi:hypothetical protein
MVFLWTSWRRALKAAVVASLVSLAAPSLAIGQAIVDVAPTDQLRTPVAVVDGFRSAKFGMTEAEVRDAIAADFGIAGDDVVEGENTAERTRLLTVSVSNLLPEGGVAQVAYVFGHRSGGLIQVGISWSRTTDPEMTEARLQANADVLLSYFQGIGYDPSSIRTGLAVDNGVLLFRGEDAQGHSTMLLLQGQFSEGDGGSRLLTPHTLALLYAADSENPDIFVIEPGQF